MQKISVPAAALALVAALAGGTAGASEGNQLLGTGPIQESLAGAGAAAAEDATWAVLNPAALVDVEKRLDVYLMYLYLDRRLEPEGLGLVSNKFAGEMSDTRPEIFPSFAVAWPRGRGVFAFGMLGVEGDAVDFDQSRSTLGRLRNADRRSALEVAMVPFAYAHRFDNGWAVGAAFLGEVGRIRSDSLTLRLRPTRGDYEWDWTLGYGWQIGVYKQWERWGFGASYRSRQDLEAFEKYKDLTRFSIDLPPQFQAGVAYRIRPELELLADYKYIGWTETKQFGEKTIPWGGLDWDDQHVAKLAAIWRVGPRWTLRGGLSYGESPLDKKVVFVNAHFPAVAEMHAAFGFSYRRSDRSEFHFSYEHAFKKEMTDNGRGGLFSFVGQGSRVSMEQDFFGLGYTYRF